MVNLNPHTHRAVFIYTAEKRQPPTKAHFDHPKMGKKDTTKGRRTKKTEEKLFVDTVHTKQLKITDFFTARTRDASNRDIKGKVQKPRQLTSMAQYFARRERRRQKNIGSAKKGTTEGGIQAIVPNRPRVPSRPTKQFHENIKVDTLDPSLIPSPPSTQSSDDSAFYNTTYSVRQNMRK